MRRTLSLLSTASLALLTLACEPQDLPEGRGKSIKVAEILGPDRQKLEILDTQTGGFMYSQTGPYGSQPMRIPPEVEALADPVEVFKALAPPGQRVPETLLAARDRAERYIASHPELMEAALAPNGETVTGSGVADPGAAAATDDIAVNRQALVSSDLHQEGRVDPNLCPWPFFTTAKSSNNLPFCPGNDAHSTCQANRSWSFISNNSAAGGWGAVCEDAPAWVPFWKVTRGGEYTDTFSVYPGTWHFVHLPAWRCCNGWPWGCSNCKNLIKFDLQQNNANSTHFGARITF